MDQAEMRKEGVGHVLVEERGGGEEVECYPIRSISCNCCQLYILSIISSWLSFSHEAEIGKFVFHLRGNGGLVHFHGI